MQFRLRFLTLITATVTAAALLLTAPAAGAAAPARSVATAGTSSLATLLAADGGGFDRDWYDFDILDNAVHAVLAAKPHSPVGLLADGSVTLTAFLPNDRAFQVVAFQLTHRWYTSESAVFTALAGALGIDKIEKVLLYHVIPGARIDAATALRSNRAVLTTALAGNTIRVQVLSKAFRLIQLVDGSRRNINPIVIPSKLNLNKGNKQIAHGIAFVLLPATI